MRYPVHAGTAVFHHGGIDVGRGGWAASVYPYPRAALLAFGVAVLAYNTLAVLQCAVWRAHELHTGDLELSSYYFADEIPTHYAGMMMAVAPAARERYD
jgi:hypothetical protein